MSTPWDYLVLTASNALQARAYEFQLDLRRQYGLLPQVRNALVVADLEDQRIGSGGSTLLCLLRIVERERLRRGGRESAGEILRRLRVLIVHAGGDSRRLPAYAPCGKIFVPVPGASDAPLPPALFDRLVPDFLALGPGVPGRGQVVVAAGDALVLFDAGHVNLAKPGLTALGCYATPEEASRHGVFAMAEDGGVSLYLQKPSAAEQRRSGAINAEGMAALDVGAMSLDAEAAETLLDAFGVAQTPAALLSGQIDLYREICCALGTAATREHYARSARASGSTWADGDLARLFPVLSRIPLHVELVPSCRFLHFGSTRQLIESGRALAGEGVLSVNNRIAAAARIDGRDSWVEGCRVEAELHLGGHNVLTGVDVDAPLSLPPGACLEVLRGRSREGADVHFIRCYGVRDTFKPGSRFCGRPLTDWLATAGLEERDVWPDAQDAAGRDLWTARVFPAERAAGDYRRWLWMYAPEAATAAELDAFRKASRYSAAEVAFLADQAAFHSRRMEMTGKAR
jgi:fucokinase